MHSIANVLNATELFILKWLILYNLNYISIKNVKNIYYAVTINYLSKIGIAALAGVVHLVGALSHKQKVHRFDSRSGHILGCRFSFRSWYIWEATSQCISLTLMFLSISPSLLFSLKSVSVALSEDLKNRNSIIHYLNDWKIIPESCIIMKHLHWIWGEDEVALKHCCCLTHLQSPLRKKINKKL